MPIFFGSIFYLSVASFAHAHDEDLQLLQTRISQKGSELGWTQEDLLTSDGENKCLNLESSSFSNWDCNGFEGRSAAVPGFCHHPWNVIYETCCKDECAVLAAAQAKSEQETQCLNKHSTYWNDWDCEGIQANSRLYKYTGFSRLPAAPAYCNHSNNCEYTTAVQTCCAKFCAGEHNGKYFPEMIAADGAPVLTRTEAMQFPDISTRDGQAQCLDNYSLGFTNTYACVKEYGFTGATPSYCNTTAHHYSNPGLLRAVHDLCCHDYCHWTPEELKTSDGQHKCMNLEGQSSRFAAFDCDGKNGRNAAVPTFCNSTNANYKLVMETCCADSCGYPEKTIPPRNEKCAPKPTTAAPTTTTTTLSLSPTPTPGSPSPSPVEECLGTDSPGGDTDVTGADCFDAESGFGPDFDCDTTEMWCAHDSGDGLTVGQCCPTKCKKECENKRKNKNEESRKKAERERKKKRAEQEESRKKAERDRKMNRKQEKWEKARANAKERNGKKEEERKDKRNWREGRRKEERGWKQLRKRRREKANKREGGRKRERTRKAGGNSAGERKRKADRMEFKAKWKRHRGR